MPEFGKILGYVLTFNVSCRLFNQGNNMKITSAALIALLLSSTLTSQVMAMSDDEIIASFRAEQNSTGNIADAIEAVTGQRGWMNSDMKSLFDAKIVGKAATALMRPALTKDKTKYPPYHLQILDEAEPGSVLIYVMEDGTDIAAIGNLMATTAQVRGLEGVVIDGAVRDVTAIRKMKFPVFARRISPATSVGRMIPVGKQIPVKCGGIDVNPGDIVVGDPDGVVVVPRWAAEKVLSLLADYDERESKMMPIILEEKSLLRAIERYNRY
jgi:4-hydroxy-4-methyl-2-oxoglutarate aldolase